MENLTKAEIQLHIKAAYDSVEVVNELKAIAKPTEYEKDRLQRNIDHLKIMMQKEWFVTGLKAAQKKQLNLIIK